MMLQHQLSILLVVLSNKHAVSYIDCIDTDAGGLSSQCFGTERVYKLFFIKSPLINNEIKLKLRF